MKNLTSHAMEISNKSMIALQENKVLLDEYHANEKEARGLMKTGREEYAVANMTFEKATNAYETAKKAKEDADNTAKEAIETLRLLTVCFWPF